MNVRPIQLDPKKIRLLEKNAHFMRHETFHRLVENVKEDNALTSTPFCAPLGYHSTEDAIQYDEDGLIIYEVLSGNHRVSSAIAAGLEMIWVLVTDEPISLERRIAIQLSHNSIFGEDDPAILKELYEGINNVSLKLYAGLDDATLQLLDEVQPISITEPNLKFNVVSLLFLPDEIDDVRAAFEEAKKMIAKDEVWLARFSEYDKYLNSLEMAGAAHKISNVATSLSIILTVFRRHLEDLQEGWVKDDEVLHNNWVPLASVIGREKIPPEAALVIKQALQRMMDEGEIQKEEKWRGVEFMAAEYLASVKFERELAKEAQK